MTGVKLDARSMVGLDMSEAITDENIGQSISSLEKPLQQMIETHRLWVQTAGAEGKQLDLSGYDLRELKSLKMEKMTAIKAENAKFFGMNLYKIEMQSAVLNNSDFRRCDLEEADMRGSSLRGVRMGHASLKNANFDPLLFGAEGAQQRFSPCHFDNAVLRYADFSGANLKSAVFKGADLSYANFSNCDLRDADFSGAVTNGTIFEEANLDNAVFEKESSGGKAFSLNSLKED